MQTSQKFTAELRREYHGVFVNTYRNNHQEEYGSFQFTKYGAVDKAFKYDYKSRKFVPVNSLSTLNQEEVDLARKVWQRSFGGGPSQKFCN